MDQTVTLAGIEWQQLLAILCNGTGPGISWATTNPLVMKVGGQLQQQTAGAQRGLGPLQNAAQEAHLPGDGLDLDPPAPRRGQPRQ